MIYQCLYCDMYFSNPVNKKSVCKDPRGWGYDSWIERREYCPYCGGDDLEFFNSLVEYNGKYYRNEIHLERTLEDMGYTLERIDRALKEATKIWEVE